MTGNERGGTPTKVAWIVGGAVVAVAASAIAVVGLWLLPATVASPIERNGIRTVSVALVAAIGAGASLFISARTHLHAVGDAQRQHARVDRLHVTQLFDSAADKLGAADDATRTAAVVILERVYNDAALLLAAEQDTNTGGAIGSLRRAVIETLCGYIRERSIRDATEWHATHNYQQGAGLHADYHSPASVRTAVAILGRLTEVPADTTYDLTAADLARVTFAGTVATDLVCKRARFGTDAQFSEATFSGRAVFTGATFAGRAEFGGATFVGTAGFDGAKFTGRAEFGEALFEAEAGFAGTTFSSMAWFHEATFRGTATFGRATFSGTAWFVEATFSGRAAFTGATFARRAEFGEAIFWDEAGFGDAKFSERAGFGGATFTGRAEFGEAVFSSEGWFGDATFSDVAGFDRARFTGVAVFAGATFSGASVFGGARFSDEAGFERARFSGVAVFAAATFSGTTWFQGARFSSAAGFQGATIHGKWLNLVATWHDAASLGDLIVATPGYVEIVIDGAEFDDRAHDPREA